MSIYTAASHVGHTHCSAVATVPFLAPVPTMRPFRCFEAHGSLDVSQ